MCFETFVTVCIQWNWLSFVKMSTVITWIVGRMTASMWLKWKHFLMKVKADLKLHFEQCNPRKKSLKREKKYNRNNNCQFNCSHMSDMSAENNQTICAIVSPKDLSIWPFRENFYGVQMSDTFGLIHGPVHTEPHWTTSNNNKKKL